MSRERLERRHPRLLAEGYAIASPISGTYNCFAWAVGYSIDAFVQAFSLLGFAVCESGIWEDGFEKIALYADDSTDEPTHAARQLPSGVWASKIGTWEDIIHRSEYALEGGDYGRVARYLRRPRTPT